MPLSDIKVRNTKPAAKPFKLYDARGLFLIVTPVGGKWWRFRYRFEGKEKLLSMGVYPDISLRDARTRRDEARKLLARHVDPGHERKAQKMAKHELATNSFEIIAREWYAKCEPIWAEHHGDRILRRLERDVFHWIGERPIAQASAPDLLAIARRIEHRGALETAHRALANRGQVFRYAVATGRTLRDPTGDLRGALPPSKGRTFL